MTETMGREMKSSGASAKCAFDLLVDDLANLMNRRGKGARPNGTAPAASTMEVNGKLVKSISHGKPFTLGKPAARESAKKNRPIVAKVERKSAVAETIAKAFEMLNGGGLSPVQRGALMLRLSALQDRVGPAAAPFAKALAAVDGDPREMKRALIGKLKELEGHLDGTAAASHLAGAAELVESARTLLDSGKLSGGDHAALSIALDDLRHKIERGSHA